MHSPPKLEIHSSLRLRFEQAVFALTAARYLRRSRYPLFTIKGAVSTYRIGRALKLHKLMQFNKQFFTSPNFPHYPSPAYDHMVAGGG